MKAIWSGSLSFGLLDIPIHIYSAIAEHKFGFRILCSTCHHPLKNVRWCEKCKKAVAWEKTVKGFEQSDGSFSVMTKEAIDKLKPEKTNVIAIKEFVDASELELLYVENHYYMVPTKKENKAFYLFAQALKKSNKVAIGQMVMREKEYLVALSFYKNMLLLNTLHYEYEIRAAEVKITKAMAPTKEELDLALLLINKLTKKKFDLSKYKDDFVEKLKKALKSAKKTKKMIPEKTAPKTKKREPEKDHSLTASLKASLRGQARA
jgi:DNA end-binding protein Ku